MGDYSAAGRIDRMFSHLVHHVNPVLKAFGQDEQDLRDEAAHTDDAPYLSVH
jgi:hypothetical protein